MREEKVLSERAFQTSSGMMRTPQGLRLETSTDAFFPCSSQGQGGRVAQRVPVRGALKTRGIPNLGAVSTNTFGEYSPPFHPPKPLKTQGDGRRSPIAFPEVIKPLDPQKRSEDLPIRFLQRDDVSSYKNKHTKKMRFCQPHFANISHFLQIPRLVYHMFIVCFCVIHIPLTIG
jgi:hypothetical protein